MLVSATGLSTIVLLDDDEDAIMGFLFSSKRFTHAPFSPAI